MVIVQVSEDTELFELAELHSEDGLKMAKQLAVALERDCPVAVDSYHGHEMHCLCAQHDEVPVLLRGTL